MNRPATGCIQIYMGNGKGKTSAALGAIMRAAGAGWRVLLLQFLKQGSFSEIRFLQSHAPDIELAQFGSGTFVRGAPGPEDRRLAAAGFARFRDAVRNGTHDLIVADELLDLFDCGLLATADAQALLSEKPAGLDIILTGRQAPPDILQLAELVTNMTCVRHPFDLGICAREGIEF